MLLTSEIPMSKKTGATFRCVLFFFNLLCLNYTLEKNLQLNTSSLQVNPFKETQQF